jgi:Kef-type K+ transport system membrane component KefB
MRPNVSVFYALLLTVLGGGIALSLVLGGRLFAKPGEAGSGIMAGPAKEAQAVPEGPSAGIGSLWKEWGSRCDNPISVLLCQAVLIILACNLMGRLAKLLGQPRVIGEMCAGILLGPTFLGAFFPGVSAFIFRPHSFEILGILSQLGVMVFLFLVGMEMDFRSMRKSFRADITISHAGILFPFLLGVLLTMVLYPKYGQSSFLALGLFMGIAMSITAFPVLARIIRDRGWADTTLGRTALTIAAIDDITAWCGLSVVVAIVKSESLGSSLAMAVSAIAFIAFILFTVRPVLGRVVASVWHTETGSIGLMGGIFILLFLSGLVTELIGLHTLFGAFLAGLAIPPIPHLKRFLRERLELICTVFLLPIFFALVGLRTNIGFLNTWSAWLILFLVTGTAVAGKFGGTLAASRFLGMEWRKSARLAILMNTRGLMELIVISIGYDLKILSPELSTIMVFMALATTAMAGPLLSLLNPEGRVPPGPHAPSGDAILASDAGRNGVGSLREP